MLLPLHLNLQFPPGYGVDWQEETRLSGKSKRKKIRLVRRLLKEYKQAEKKALIIEEKQELIDFDLYKKLVYEQLLIEFDKEVLSYKEALRIERFILETKAKAKEDEIKMIEIDLAYIIIILASVS